MLWVAGPERVAFIFTLIKIKKIYIKFEIFSIKIVGVFFKNASHKSKTDSDFSLVTEKQGKLKRKYLHRVDYGLCLFCCCFGIFLFCYENCQNQQNSASKNWQKKNENGQRNVLSRNDSLIAVYCCKFTSSYCYIRHQCS